MLSPGKYHLALEKDPNANLERRLKAYQACRLDEGYRRAVLRMCQRDILFYVNLFCWTYRPKAAGSAAKVVPFITWEGQDRSILYILDHVERQVSFAAQKSRDMGWSWMCCYVADWLWRFHDWTTTGMFSRIGELVDSKKPDSLFWKIRFIQRHLPEWMWPKGWNPRIHDTENYRENPQTHSVIIGSATTKDMGVAGRCTWAVFDEFSRVPNAFTVRDNTKDTSDCRAFVSTHTGPGTCFHQICTNGVTDVITSHWSEHPEKARGLYRYNADTGQVEVLDKTYLFPPDYQFVRDGTPSDGPHPGLRSVWYDRECRDRSATDVRTNLDISVHGSTSQFFDPLAIHRLTNLNARDPFWEGDLIYDSEQAKPIRLHKREGGPVKLWLTLRPDGKPPVARYGAGADIATGTGATPSTLTLANDRGEKVLEYANAHIRAELFAELAVAVCRLFVDEFGDGARFAWEHSGAGGAFTKRVVELGYANVYYRVMEFGWKKPKADQVGWSPNPMAKRTLLEEYRGALESGKFLNRSKPALEECLHYVQMPNTGVEHSGSRSSEDPAAARENHGDRVIADALCWKMIAELGIISPERPGDSGPPVLSLEWRRNYRKAREQLQEV